MSSSNDGSVVGFQNDDASPSALDFLDQAPERGTAKLRSSTTLKASGHTSLGSPSKSSPVRVGSKNLLKLLPRKRSSQSASAIGEQQRVQAASGEATGSTIRKMAVARKKASRRHSDGARQTVRIAETESDDGIPGTQVNGDGETGAGAGMDNGDLHDLAARAAEEGQNMGLKQHIDAVTIAKRRSRARRRSYGDAEGALMDVKKQKGLSELQKEKTEAMAMLDDLEKTRVGSGVNGVADGGIGGAAAAGTGLGLLGTSSRRGISVDGSKTRTRVADRRLDGAGTTTAATATAIGTLGDKLEGVRGGGGEAAKEGVAVEVDALEEGLSALRQRRASNDSSRAGAKKDNVNRSEADGDALMSSLEESMGLPRIASSDQRALRALYRKWWLDVASGHALPPVEPKPGSKEKKKLKKAKEKSSGQEKSPASRSLDVDVDVKVEVNGAQRVSSPPPLAAETDKESTPATTVKDESAPRKAFTADTSPREVTTVEVVGAAGSSDGKSVLLAETPAVAAEELQKDGVEVESTGAAVAAIVTNSTELLGGSAAVLGEEKPRKSKPKKDGEDNKKQKRERRKDGGKEEGAALSALVSPETSYAKETGGVSAVESSSTTSPSALPIPPPPLSLSSTSSSAVSPAVLSNGGNQEDGQPSVTSGVTTGMPTKEQRRQRPPAVGPKPGPGSGRPRLKPKEKTVAVLGAAAAAGSEGTSAPDCSSCGTERSSSSSPGVGGTGGAGGSPTCSGADGGGDDGISGAPTAKLKENAAAGTTAGVTRQVSAVPEGAEGGRLLKDMLELVEDATEEGKRRGLKQPVNGMAAARRRSRQGSLEGKPAEPQQQLQVQSAVPVSAGPVAADVKGGPTDVVVAVDVTAAALAGKVDGKDGGEEVEVRGSDGRDGDEGGNKEEAQPARRGRAVSKKAVAVPKTTEGEAEVANRDAQVAAAAELSAKAASPAISRATSSSKLTDKVREGLTSAEGKQVKLVSGGDLVRGAEKVQVAPATKAADEAEVEAEFDAAIARRQLEEDAEGEGSRSQSKQQQPLPPAPSSSLKLPQKVVNLADTLDEPLPAGCVAAASVVKAVVNGNALNSTTSTATTAGGAVRRPKLQASNVTSGAPGNHGLRDRKRLNVTNRRGVDNGQPAIRREGRNGEDDDNDDGDDDDAEEEGVQAPKQQRIKQQQQQRQQQQQQQQPQETQRRRQDERKKVNGVTPMSTRRRRPDDVGMGEPTPLNRFRRGSGTIVVRDKEGKLVKRRERDRGSLDSALRDDGGGDGAWEEEDYEDAVNDGPTTMRPRQMATKRRGGSGEANTHTHRAAMMPPPLSPNRAVMPGPRRGVSISDDATPTAAGAPAAATSYAAYSTSTVRGAQPVGGGNGAAVQTPAPAMRKRRATVDGGTPATAMRGQLTTQRATVALVSPKMGGGEHIPDQPLRRFRRGSHVEVEQEADGVVIGGGGGGHTRRVSANNRAGPGAAGATKRGQFSSRPAGAGAGAAAAGQATMYVAHTVRNVRGNGNEGVLRRQSITPAFQDEEEDVTLTGARPSSIMWQGEMDATPRAVRERGPLPSALAKGKERDQFGGPAEGRGQHLQKRAADDNDDDDDDDGGGDGGELVISKEEIFEDEDVNPAMVGHKGRIYKEDGKYLSVLSSTAAVDQATRSRDNPLNRTAKEVADEDAEEYDSDFDDDNEN